jgi:hypothetical protein
MADRRGFRVLNRFVHRREAGGATRIHAGPRVVANRLSTGTRPVEQCEPPSHGTKATKNRITVSSGIDRVFSSPGRAEGLENARPPKNRHRLSRAASAAAPSCASLQIRQPRPVPGSRARQDFALNFSEIRSFFGVSRPSRAITGMLEGDVTDALWQFAFRYVGGGGRCGLATGVWTPRTI